MSRPQKNNAEYFSHDVWMRDHRKVRMVRTKHWNEWYAIFCMMLEVLADSEWFVIHLDDVQMELLSNDFMIDIEDMKSIIETLKRVWLIQQEWSTIYNENLIERMQPLMKKRELMRDKYEQQNSKKKWSWPPWKSTKPKMTQEQFEQFWTAYPVKQWRKKVMEKFLKLDPSLFESIMSWITKHSKWKKWKEWFVPMPETFINQERWNDEITEFISHDTAHDNKQWQSFWTYPKKNSANQGKESTTWTSDLIV